MSSGSTGSLLGSFLKRRGSGYLVIGVGLAGYLLALVFLPDLGDPATRHRYEPFFTTAGVVAAGIFVALAVASREVTSNVVLGIATIFLVGTAVLASVLALLPDVCSLVYSVAFLAVVGGGLGSLFSTALIAAVGLFEARAERQARTLEALRALSEKIANEQRGGGSSS
jgi:peptidoglycan/LPS O-acetylase OafA/YrhL